MTQLVLVAILYVVWVEDGAPGRVEVQTFLSDRYGTDQ